ncbi:hypothetical protein MAXJ12_31487 [Mesorhizobium alhagi CCNWXJ12-2]|uniref:Uncharacterized protein n=1 Tax=Mesorhizobium alhagi CCNWXJ12-2 TaxID=1107882 RepID=H0I1G0_9HYPH|nr:hypothetical protein MAXJ12_31487 [Mesorhizobium alhagi CCNWXJ12-2]
MDNHCDLQHLATRLNVSHAGRSKAFQPNCSVCLHIALMRVKSIALAVSLGHGRPFDSKQPPLLMPIKAGLVACA